MKIAVANHNNQVEPHLGQCQDYLIYEIKDNKITGKEHLHTDTNGGCKSNIFNDLRSLGVAVLLAGNIGKGAYNKLQLNKIEVLPGFRGESDQAIMDYLKGELPKTNNLCQGHKNEHHKE
ncbi:MAG: NifB/NifX family molybdenum-iron cluster-binding protein [Cyclobacteriaceae bacterium]